MSVSRISGYVKGLVWEDEGLVCSLCGLPLSVTDSATIAVNGVRTQNPWGFSEDHEIPRALGGKDTVENIRPAHIFCNESRGAQPLTEALADELRRKISALQVPSSPRNSFICGTCGGAFHSSPARLAKYNKAYCSVECSVEALRRRVKLFCASCNGAYEEVLSRGERSSFCSKICQSRGEIDKERDELICSICFGSFYLAKTNMRPSARSRCGGCRKSPKTKNF